MTGPPSLLIVDRDRYASGLIRSICGGLGFSPVFTAHDSESGLDAFKQHRPDIVIVGRALAPKNGLSFTAACRDPMASPAPMVPILMVSEFSEASEVLAARDCGVHELIAKPVAVKTIFGRLRETIEKPRDFVMTADYFGPDRRHANRPPPGEDRRRGRKANRTEATPTIDPNSAFARNFRRLSEQVGQR